MALYDYTAFSASLGQAFSTAEHQASSSAYSDKEAHDVDLVVQSRLHWCIPTPDNHVAGVSFKVKVPANFGNDPELHFSDAIQAVVAQIKKKLKKLGSISDFKGYCDGKLASIQLLMEYVVRGHIEAGQSVQNQFQEMFHNFLAFCTFLSDSKSDPNNSQAVSETIIRRSLDETMERTALLLKQVLDLCTFETPRQKQQAEIIYQAALVDFSQLDFVPGHPELSGRYQLLRGTSKESIIIRTTPLTATRLLFDLRLLFQDEEFQRRYRTLRSSAKLEANREALQLVLEIYGQVLPRYGFDSSAKGVQWMRNECGFWAQYDSIVFKLRSDIHFLVESGRSDLMHPSTLSLEKFKVQPLVIAVIPTHRGREHLLRDAVVSALTQTYGNVEVVISVQNIPAFEDRKYLRLISEMYRTVPGVSVVPASPSGEAPHNFEDWRRQGRAAFVRNEALKHATGDFVAFLDDDDVWLRWKVSEQLSAMCQAKSDISASEAYGGDLHMLRAWDPFAWTKDRSPPGGMSLYNRELNRDVLDVLVPDYSPEDSTLTSDILKQHNVIVTSTVIMSSALLDRVGLMSITAKNEDHDLWLRAIDLTGSILAIPDALSVYDCTHGELHGDDVSD